MRNPKSLRILRSIGRDGKGSTCVEPSEEVEINWARWISVRSALNTYRPLATFAVGHVLLWYPH